MERNESYNRLLNALAAEGISAWRVRESCEESSELFFVRRMLDQRRATNCRTFTVTVFRDGAGQDGPTRGSADVTLLASDGEPAMREALRGAYTAAGCAANPFYELPDPVSAPFIAKTGDLATLPLEESGARMAEALFAADTREDAFLNSAEVFVTRTTCRITASNGTDVSFSDAKVKGEFVVQCRAPEDVELHNTFSYGELDVDALRAKAAEALTFAADRAKATRTLPSGTYDVVLSGNALPAVLSFYAERSSAGMLYAKYSTWKPGDAVQGSDLRGDALDLTLFSDVPYDREGVPLRELPLLTGGTLQAVHGSSRFCRYLGVAPTGDCGGLRCANGELPFEALKRAPCLWAVTFSDFQMDSFTGHFGGEIRLAYLIGADGSVRPVTGGSVNGSLFDVQGDMRFSAERYETSSYDGPYAVRLPGVSVSGSDGNA